MLELKELGATMFDGVAAKSVRWTGVRVFELIIAF